MFLILEFLIYMSKIFRTVIFYCMIEYNMESTWFIGINN